MTQAELAKYLGMSRACYIATEQDKRDLTLEEAVRLVDMFHNVKVIPGESLWDFIQDVSALVKGKTKKLNEKSMKFINFYSV